MYESRGIYDCKILVAKGGDGFLVEAHPEISKGMDGIFLSDNHFKNVPTEPAIYVCRVEFFFMQGYFEGYRADGESDWYYEIRSAVRQEEPAVLARLKELEERHEADEKKLGEGAERIKILDAHAALSKKACGDAIEWVKAAIEKRTDLPAGLASELTELTRGLFRVMDQEEGWETFHLSEFLSMELRSHHYDIRKIATDVLGYVLKEHEYLPAWQVVGNLKHRMAALREVQAAAKAVVDAYTAEGCGVDYEALVEQRLEPALVALRALEEGFKAEANGREDQEALRS